MYTKKDLFSDLDASDCNYSAHRYLRARQLVKDGRAPLGGAECMYCEEYPEDCDCYRMAATELLSVCKGYERGITWETTCKNCANLMDKLYEYQFELEELRREFAATLDGI